MDLLELVKGLFSGMNFSQMIAFVVGGMFLKMLVDKVVLFALAKWWPKEAIKKYILDNIRWFDDNVIDPYKEKYPESGAKLEGLLAGILQKGANIIKDEE